MSINLAPVLDVYYKSGSFIDQYQRSYSNNAQTVTSCGQAFITAQQQTGVAATAKHFPGLGSASRSQNADTGPVTLPVSLTKLHTVDEVPYPAAIAAGVKLVMASWAIYPALDAKLPAGLSPTVIQQELRGRNAFTGVTITDALEAGALNAFGTTGQRAVTAAGAGMDLILCSARDVSQSEAACLVGPVQVPAAIEHLLAFDVGFEDLAVDAERAAGEHHEVRVLPLLQRPDAVVEVLSPGDRQRDIEEKIRVYLACGSSVVFLVDTDAQTVTATAKYSVETFHPDELVRHASLPGFALRARCLFDSRATQ